MNVTIPAGMVLGCALLLAAPVARAADAGAEMATAAAHAGMAAASTDMKMVQAHLHHVANCLAGPGGMGYDASQLNPCKDQGMGAMVDAPAAKKKMLEDAMAKVESGLKQSDMAMAKKDAGDAEAMIKKAM